MTSSTVWDTLGIFLMICTAAWLIGRPSAKFEKELNDHRACFWILLFFGSFLGGFPLLVCVDMIHKNRPVTQAIFDAAKAADPSCNRYEAFRADRLAKGVVFDIRDLGRAKDECIEHNEKTAALEQQKAIK
jgi:hypothetical protein